MNTGTELDEIITPFEMQHLISILEKLDVTLYGSKKWLKHHEQIEKLNNQAHRNAINGNERGMVEDFISGWDSGTNQVDTLIYDLLVTEAWKDNVFPLVKKRLDKDLSLKTYMMLYHEATVANLIEVLMFHKDAIEDSQDSVIELIDFWYRKLVWLANLGDDKPKDLQGKEIMEQSREDELKRQYLEIQFSVAMICLSIIRFISDNLSYLDIPIVHQMMEVNDIPCILVPIMESKPWLRKNAKGEQEVYEDQRWQARTDTQTVPKIEAQIWLTIFSMFMCQDTQRKYEVTTFRKSNLLRLRKFLNEVLLDQIPVLSTMLRSLEELSLMQESSIPSSNPFHVQVIPEIRSGIVANKKWRDIADYQIKEYFTISKTEAMEEMKGIMNLYNSDMIEDFLEQPKWGTCGKDAKNRCSKWKHEWYWSRDCQIKGWKGHKKLWGLLAESISEEKKAKDKDKKEKKEKHQQEKENKVLIQEIKPAQPAPTVVSDVVRDLEANKEEAENSKIQEIDQNKQSITKIESDEKSTLIEPTEPVKSASSMKIEEIGDDDEEGEIDFDDVD